MRWLVLTALVACSRGGERTLPAAWTSPLGSSASSGADTRPASATEAVIRWDRPGMGALAFCPGDAELVTVDGGFLRRWRVADGTQLAATHLIEDAPALAAELGLQGAWKDGGADPLSVRCRADGAALVLGVLVASDDSAVFRTAFTVDRAGKLARAPTKQFIVHAEFAPDDSITLVCASECRGFLVWRGALVSDGPKRDPTSVGQVVLAEASAYVESTRHQPPAGGDGLAVVIGEHRFALRPDTTLGAASVAAGGSVAVIDLTLTNAWGWSAKEGRLGARFPLAPFGAVQTHQVIATDHYFVTRDLSGKIHYARHGATPTMTWTTIDHPCGEADEIGGYQSHVVAVSHDQSRLAVVCEKGGVRLIPFEPRL